jgi:mannose-6-phosphate isomerase-like protein (cupin superfamily)
MRATYIPDSPLPPAHLHPNQDEHFEVLEGTLRFLIDDTEHIVPAGQAIDVPRGSVHQVHNPERGARRRHLADPTSAAHR